MLVFGWCTWLQSGQKNDLLHQHSVHGWRSSVRIAHARTLYLVCECSNYWKFSRHVNIPVSIYHCDGNRQTVSKIMTDHIHRRLFYFMNMTSTSTPPSVKCDNSRMVCKILPKEKESSSISLDEFWRKKIMFGYEAADNSTSIEIDRHVEVKRYRSPFWRKIREIFLSSASKWLEMSLVNCDVVPKLAEPKSWRNKWRKTKIMCAQKVYFIH